MSTALRDPFSTVADGIVESPLVAIDTSSWPALDGIASSGLPVCATWLSPGGVRGVHGCQVTLGDTEAIHRDGRTAEAAVEGAAQVALARFVWRHGRELAERLHVGTATSVPGRAMPLETIAGYSSALRAQRPGRLGWTSETSFTWVEGISLVRRAPCWLPFQLVSGVRPEGIDEPELRPTVPTGIAVHPDRSRALLHALLEVVERDAFMVTWLDDLPRTPLDLHGAPEPLGDLLVRFRASGLRVRAARLSTDHPIPVAVVVVSDESSSVVGVGVAGRPELGDAVSVALLRAYGIWQRVRGTRQDGPVSPRDPSALHGHQRALWWNAGGRAARLWSFAAEETGREAIPVPALSRPDAGSEVHRLVDWCRAAGEEVVAVDLVDRRPVERLGHHVVAVVVPGFHPMHVDETCPARWSPRLRKLPAALGLPIPAVINATPHPLG